MKNSKIFAASLAALALAGCSDNEYIGDVENLHGKADQINFSLKAPAMTRADIVGASAAEMLGRNFIVEGTKGTEADDAPTSTVVFDNYLVKFEENTAGTTESNSHNWEYVGITESAHFASDVLTNLHQTATEQTIKYWDYSQPQYDFLAYSTGTKTAITSGTPTTGQVLVEKIATGTTLASHAYSFTAPSADELKECYITDIQEVNQANYGKVVTLKFKNLTSKIRMGIYETVPGYSVKDVKFYSDNTTSINPGATSTDAVLFTEGGTSAVLPASGTIVVKYPHIGNDNASKDDYNKAQVDVTPSTGAGSTVTTLGFNALTANYGAAEKSETADNIYLGRTLPNATMAGSSDAQFYQAVMPNNNPQTLTLRVDYTLVSIDGSGEEIKVYGAKAVVPSTYTNWLPNYAYTYIFKISDNTNGKTANENVDLDGDGTPDGPAPDGLFPITFDAVVAEMTDFNAEQTTVTTVATPSITTYQQGHTKAKNEYSIATGKDIYVQVMDNSNVPAEAVTNLDEDNALLYLLGEDATEALVMDALVNQSAEASGNITGRNGLTLTKQTNIDATVTTIENGVDDNPITISAGEAAKIGISGLTAGNSYAFVYVQTASDAANTIDVYQPIAVATPGTTKVNNVQPLSVTTIVENATAATGTAVKDMLYFSKTTNGTGTTTWSYVTVKVGETSVDGLYAVAASELGAKITSEETSATSTFYFDVYKKNDGKYAVKVIKVVE